MVREYKRILRNWLSRRFWRLCWDDHKRCFKQSTNHKLADTIDQSLELDL